MTQFYPKFDIYTLVKPYAMERHTPDRIDAILESLGGMERAMPAPFLHTRIVARMQRESSGGLSRAMYFLARPAVAISMSMLLILLNAYVIYSGTEASPAASEEYGMAAAQDYGAHFAATYEPLSDDAP
jgi:hypothetical protein